MKVKYTYNPDLSMVGTIVDVAEDEARSLIRGGRAVAVDENAPDPVDALVKAHTKDSLVTLAADRGVEVGDGDTKADIAAAIVAAVGD